MINKNYFWRLPHCNFYEILSSLASYIHSCKLVEDSGLSVTNHSSINFELCLLTGSQLCLHEWIYNSAPVPQPTCQVLCTVPRFTCGGGGGGLAKLLLHSLHTIVHKLYMGYSQLIQPTCYTGSCVAGFNLVADSALKLWRTKFGYCVKWSLPITKST